MSPVTTEHPSEELLTEYALSHADARVAEHCSLCDECARVVEEVEEVVTSLQRLPDEPLPLRIRERILRDTSRKPPAWFSFALSSLFRNPFAVGLGAILLTLFLYFFFMFVA
jgi:anti-sigma factor RsiW